MKRWYSLCLIMTMILCLGQLDCATAETTDVVTVGDCFSFGVWEQDNNTKNGSEPIEWRVLATEGDRLLLITVNGIDTQCYDNSSDCMKRNDLWWGTSSLCKWMNEEFYANAFNENEKAAILCTQNTNKMNDNTMDYVFCLSTDEVHAYFANDAAMACKPSMYAKKKIGKKNALDNQGYGIWWLRDMASTYNNAGRFAFMETTYNTVAYVNQREGIVDREGMLPLYYDGILVRPAMWVEMIPVKGITIEEKKVNLLLGEEESVVDYTIDAEVKPINASRQELIWSSSNEKVLSVDQSGKVTATGKGKATITVKAAHKVNGKTEAKQTVTFTVTQGVTAIDVTANEMTVGIGKSVKIAATVLPKHAANKTLEWKTSDPSIATVSSGNVTGKGVGECDITCTSKDGSGISAVVHVTVVKPITSLKAKTASLILNRGEITKANVDILPTDATNQTLIWTSSDESVAQVDSQGNITAIGCGNCVITGSAQDGSNKTVKISVKVPTIQAVSEVKIKEFKQNYRGIEATKVHVQYYGRGEIKAKVSSTRYFEISVSAPENNNVTLEILPKRAGTATITLTDTQDAASKVQISVTIHASAVPVEITAGQSTSFGGQVLQINSVSFSNSYKHEFWYNSRRGKRITMNAYDGIYMIVKATLTNRTGRSLRPDDQLSIQATDATGEYAVSVHFPVDYQSTLPSMYLYDGHPIYNNESKKMVYLIDIPEWMKNSSSLRLYFKNGENDIVGVFYKGN